MHTKIGYTSLACWKTFLVNDSLGAAGHHITKNVMLDQWFIRLRLHIGKRFRVRHASGTFEHQIRFGVYTRIRCKNFPETSRIRSVMSLWLCIRILKTRNFTFLTLLYIREDRSTKNLGSSAIYLLCVWPCTKVASSNTDTQFIGLA